MKTHILIVCVPKSLYFGSQHVAVAHAWELESNRSGFRCWFLSSVFLRELLIQCKPSPMGLFGQSCVLITLNTCTMHMRKKYWLLFPHLIHQFPITGSL